MSTSFPRPSLCLLGWDRGWRCVPLILPRARVLKILLEVCNFPRPLLAAPVVTLDGAVYFYHIRLTVPTKQIHLVPRSSPLALGWAGSHSACAWVLHTLIVLRNRIFCAVRRFNSNYFNVMSCFSFASALGFLNFFWDGKIWIRNGKICSQMTPSWELWILSILLRKRQKRPKYKFATRRKCDAKGFFLFSSHRS